MNNDQINTQYYIVLNDEGVVESHLPQGIEYNDFVLTFTLKDKIDFHIIYAVHHSLNVTLQFSAFAQINLIETKLIEKDAQFIKKMDLQHDAHVSSFLENLYENANGASSLEEVHLQNEATCHMGYAELSDGSFEGHYRYYLDGEGAKATLRMAILSKNKEKKHYEVLIQHNKPHTYGQMDNYGVCKDEGHLTIDGIGTITKGQHGSASHQTNKIMVFDEACVASANPYLYIDEYDVKASHAAGVGKMDEEHLYYLQSRGLTKKQAMQLITYGYLRPVIDIVENESLKERFEKALLKVGA